MITKDDISQALVTAGVKPGDVVFSHANIGFFGRVEGAGTMEELIGIMFEAFDEVLGPDGTLVLPVFTYSFGADKDDKLFDVQRTLSTTSGMGNWLIETGNGHRSADPMLSVVARGGAAKDLTADIDPICFGDDSIWARLHERDALICNLNFDSGSTYLHWIERQTNVPYRSDVELNGRIIDNGTTCESSVIYTGRRLEDAGAVPKFERWHTACVDAGISKISSLGRGQIVSQRARDAREFLIEQLHRDPDLLIARGVDAG